MFSLRALVHRSYASAFAVALACLTSAGPILAQADGGKITHNLGEKTSEALGRLKGMHDAKDWEGMITLLDAIPGVKPGSYDEAVILDTKAKIYGAMEQFGKALQPWERALELSEQHGYFSPGQSVEIVGYLAQLFAQEAIASKESKTHQEYLAKSLHYFRRSWEKGRPPTAEALLTYSSLLFHQATANPKQPESTLLDQAREAVDRGLQLSVKPKEGFYQMRLAVLQQQNDFPGAAELIELILHQKPASKDYWQPLVSIYQQLALKAKEDNPTLAQEYLVRAIVTIERAQALGYLQTPKDNLARASLYLTAGQFTQGTAILHDGLKKGTIESDPNNWRLLARFHQEAHQPESARAVLLEAVALFPTSGEIEAQLAHLCMQMENTADALRHAQAAVAKGNFETTKAFSVHHLIAYTAYDLGRLEEAQKAIAAAEAFPEELARDSQFSTLKSVIAEALEAKASAALKKAGSGENKKSE